MYEELKKQLKSDGSVDQEAYDLLRKLGPMPCVDAVLVPRDDKPSVILVLRGDTTVAPNQYWVVGGRVNKGEKLEETAQRKARIESGLDLIVTSKDQLFSTETIFTEPPFDQGLPGMVHTTNTVYLAMTPPIDEIRDQIKPGDGNSRFNVFSKIDSGWHTYIQRCVQKAWERAF